MASAYQTAKTADRHEPRCRSVVVIMKRCGSSRSSSASTWVRFPAAPERALVLVSFLPLDFFFRFVCLSLLLVFSLSNLEIRKSLYWQIRITSVCTMNYVLHPQQPPMMQWRLSPRRSKGCIFTPCTVEALWNPYGNEFNVQPSILRISPFHCPLCRYIITAAQYVWWGGRNFAASAHQSRLSSPYKKPEPIKVPRC